MNAIILAAGMGTRLRPLTENLPKALVKVNGEAMVERQIRYLREKNIDDIIVVTGYLHEKFDFLTDKYDVKLIYNDKFDIYNNGYTMYLVRDYLGDSYVIEGDVFLRNNFLKSDLNSSTYFSGIKKDFKGEWILKFDDRDKVDNIVIGDGTDYIMSGVSYWSKNDALYIRESLEDIVGKNGFDNLFWDSVVKDNIDKFHISIEKIASYDWFEIDSLEDLEKAEKFIL